ncbi:mesoderm posterior protein 1-like [Ambystoma mexicanum]|uniref:mesoderm posterior protein 1-like n=1 Tax=Ambystoma mexicanum TaxID=8296 RepID=UPI0037E86578
MDFSQTQLRPCDYLLPPDCQGPPLGYPDSEGYSSLSPASSTDSYGLSPPYLQFAFPQDLYGGFFAPADGGLPSGGPQTPPGLKSRKAGRCRVAGTQRYSASEREKMRMRNLSKALQGLRRYLPPSVAPAGKSLTKIETLQLTIRYISHLSDLLGVSEESLAQGRQSSRGRRCDLCPEGLGCSQDSHHAPCAQESTDRLAGLHATLPCQPSPYCAERPGVYPSSQGAQPDSWFPSSCSERSTNSHPHPMGHEAQLPAYPYCGDMRTVPLQRAAAQPHFSSPLCGEMRSLPVQPEAPQPHFSSTLCGEMRTLPVQPEGPHPCPSSSHQSAGPRLSHAAEQQDMDTAILPFFTAEFCSPVGSEELDQTPEGLPISSPASPDLGFYQVRSFSNVH